MYVWVNQLPGGLDGAEGSGRTPGCAEPCGPGWMVPVDAAAVSVRDRGLLLGDGVFDTLLFCRGRFPFLGRHLERLAASARTLGFPPPPPLHAVLPTLLARNGWAEGEGVGRITYTRGPGDRGYEPPADPHPFCLVQLFPGLDRPRGSWRAVVSRVPVVPHPVLSQVKHTSALPRILARAEALEAGADEVLFCTPEGVVLEGMRTNLFWVRGGVLYTPAVDVGCLPGVARGWVLEWAATAGLPVREGAFVLDTVDAAEEVFATNSLYGPVPLAEVVGRGRWPAPGPVTQQAMEAWRRTVGAVVA